MIEILAAIGLIVVLAAICSALEQRHYNAGEWAIRNQARVEETIKAEYEAAERERQNAEALRRAREAMEAGDQELAHYWFESVR
jgi:hypothetical protein